MEIIQSLAAIERKYTSTIHYIDNKMVRGNVIGGDVIDLRGTFQRFPVLTRIPSFTEGVVVVEMNANSPQTKCGLVNMLQWI